jgi:hypothetical protein
MLLAFVPSERIKVYYLLLKNYVIQNNIKYTENSLKYFETTYIGLFDENNSIVREPIYDHGFWNVFERVKQNVPRTTNFLEAWHRVLNSKVAIKHPNFAHFITILQKERNF